MFLSPSLCLGYMRRQTQEQALDTNHTNIFIYLIHMYILKWASPTSPGLCLYLDLEHLSFLVDCEDSNGE